MNALTLSPSEEFYEAFLTPPVKRAYREIRRRTNGQVLKHFEDSPDHFREYETDKRGFIQFRNYLFRQNAKIVFASMKCAKIRKPYGSFMTELHGTHIVHYKEMKSFDVPFWLPKAIREAMYREAAEDESYQPPLSGFEATIPTPIEQLIAIVCGTFTGMDGRIAAMYFVEQIGQSTKSRYELELSDEATPLIDNDAQSNSKTSFNFRGGDNDDGQEDSG